MTELVALCTYRVKAGFETKFEGHLKKHWPTLHKMGLVTSKPSQVFRGKDKSGVFYTEILEWKDKTAPNEAHHLPEVMSVWEPMGMCVEDLDCKPGMEFPEVERLDLHS